MLKLTDFQQQSILVFFNSLYGQTDDRHILLLNIIKIILNIQAIMTDKQIDKNLQLPQTNPLYSDVSWITKKIDYSKMSYPQLQAENQKILNTLKTIQNKLTQELQQKKIPTKKYVQTQNIKALDDKIKNNQKLITALKNDSQSADHRKVIINQGLQSKTIENKFALQRSITKLKSQIKQLKLQQHETQKILGHHDEGKPQHHEQHTRMEEQLRVVSIKYVRLLDKYNRSTQKLALVSKVEVPQLQIPEDIYDKQLQQRQQAQYKQYQGIVKLCTVLSHRNDSQHNKAHRQYTLKLKDLQRTIMKLGQLDQAITSRERQLMESKKNIELIKVKMSNDQKQDNRAMRLSQGSIISIHTRTNSTAKILNPPLNENKSLKQSEDKGIKLRNRGYSLSRIKMS